MSQRWHYSSKNAFKYLLAGALGSCLAAFMLFSYPELSGNSMENKGTRQQHLMANHSKVSEGAMVSPPNPIEPAERARPSELNDAPSDGSLAGKDQAASSLVDAETAGEGDDEGGRVGAVRPEVTSVHPFTAPAAGGSVITISGFSLCRSESISTLAYVGGRSCGALQCLAAGSLECVLPGGVGRALDVSVVTFYDAGGANTSTGSRPNTLFSYEDPALESIAPMQGRSTGGTHVTLTGSNFGPSTLELPPKVYFGNSTCLRPERLSDSTIVCATPPHSEGVAVVTIAVGPDDAPVMPGKGLRFVFVETPAERMLSLSAAAVAGLNLRPARQNGELPIVLHRGSVTHSAPEVQFVDPATNRSGAFLVPAHVIDDLPDEDLRKDFKSCAVVGESASLLDAGLAAEIDKHQAVIRLAHAPVSGYKQHVGKKTTIRVGDQSYLDALAALLADRSEPGIAKSEAAARSPLLAWGSGVFDRLHLCRSQGLPPSNLRLAAPWLQSTAQSVYAELLGRYESLGLRDAALEALGAPSDEATGEQAARLLARVADPRAPQRTPGDGEEEFVPSSSEGGPSPRPGAAWYDSSGPDGDAEVGDSDPHVPREQGSASRRRLSSKPMPRSQHPQGPRSEGQAPPRGWALDPDQGFLAKPQPSAEFCAVLLALQLCRRVDSYGLPSLAVLRELREASGQAEGGSAGERVSLRPWMSSYHPYSYDGVYYSDAPDAVLSFASAASAAAQRAMTLEREQQTTSTDGGLQPQGSKQSRAGSAPATKQGDEQAQIVFEAVLWRMLAFTGNLIIRA